MQVFEYGSGSLHKAPMPNGPTVQLVVDAKDPERRMSAARVFIPAGCAMAQHDHGESEALVLGVEGTLFLVDDEAANELAPGTMIHIKRGDKVRVENRGSSPASMLAVFTPASFVDKLAGWPAA